MVVLGSGGHAVNREIEDLLGLHQADNVAELVEDGMDDFRGGTACIGALELVTAAADDWGKVNVQVIKFRHHASIDNLVDQRVPFG